MNETRGGKYFFDEAIGAYVPNTTVPPPPAFPIPPVARPVTMPEATEILAATAPLMMPSRSADSATPTMNKRHGMYTGMVAGSGHRPRSNSGSGASQRPRLKTILASPNVDSGSFGTDAALASLTLGPLATESPPSSTKSSAPPLDTLTVKVLYTQSSNVLLRVPRDISLPKLRTKIAHKFSEGVGVSLSRDGEYEWALELVASEGSPVKLADDAAWKAVSDGAQRVVVRVV